MHLKPSSLQHTGAALDEDAWYYRIISLDGKHISVRTTFVVAENGVYRFNHCTVICIMVHHSIYYVDF